jgi:hypothetical protein
VLRASCVLLATRRSACAVRAKPFWVLETQHRVQAGRRLPAAGAGAAPLWSLGHAARSSDMT